MSERCAIYCRVSDKGAKDAYGMDSQERECRDYAESKGWTVTHVYQDWHTGTELFERPEITRMLTDVRAGAFDVLLVHRLDRLSREMSHQNVIMYEVERAGARWDSATEDVTGPNGVIMRAVLGAMAELDRSKIVSGMARGKREKVAAGRPLGQGKAAYGLRFRKDESGRHIGWEEAPETVGNVRRIFHNYDSGMSLRSLGKALEADGILPPYHDRTGSMTWQASSLRSILTDPVYTGKGEAFRTISTKVLDRTTGTKKRERRARPESERVKLPEGIAPVVIEPEVFLRVQARLQANRSNNIDFRQTRNPEVGILRRGLAYCGQCGNKLVVVTSRGVPSYRCEGRERTGCPSAVTIPVERVDGAVWNWLTEVLSDEERVKWHLEQPRTTDPNAHHLETLDRQRAELEKRQKKFVSAIALLEDEDSAAPIAAELDRIGKALKANTRDREDLRARRDAWQREQAASADILKRCKQIAADMARVTDWADRRAIAQALKVRFELFPADHEPRWIVTSQVVPDITTGPNQYTVSECTAGM
jgi:site-specific DNA recombinase